MCTYARGKKIGLLEMYKRKRYKKNREKRDKLRDMMSNVIEKKKKTRKKKE